LILYSLPIFLSGPLLRPWVSLLFAALSTAAAVLMNSFNGHETPGLYVVLEFLFIACIAWPVTYGLEQAARRAEPVLT
jgi:hypothetical protein